MTNPRTRKPYTMQELLILRGWHSRLSKEYKAITQALWRMKHPAAATQNQRRTAARRSERNKQRKAVETSKYQPE